MAFKVLGLTLDESFKIPAVHTIESLSELKDRSIGFVSTILNYSKNRTIAKILKVKIGKACPWLSVEQVEEIQIIFSKLKNKVFDEGLYKLKKFSELSSGKRCQFSYIIRPNDVLVHTGVCIGSGNSKAVDLILRIEKSGEIHFLTNAKLKKEKRNPKYDRLTIYEYKVRELFSSRKILSAGDMYHYFSKSGERKMAWIVPHYNNTAACVIKARTGCSLEIIKEQERIPLKALRVCLLMALALEEMHKIDWLHRDIKLENYLVNMDEKNGEIKDLVLADTAFATPIVAFNLHREKTIYQLKKKFFEAQPYTVEKWKERNPLFFEMSSDTEFPSKDRYEQWTKSSTSMDLDFTLLMEFLHELDQHLIVGTPNHIAPEIYETRSYSKKVDIYALGASFVRIKEQMEGISLFSEDVDLEFDLLTESLINKDPQNRPNLPEIITKLEKMIIKQS